ncbi:hypothetical protein FF1_047220 [Malus domestica]
MRLATAPSLAPPRWPAAQLRRALHQDDAVTTSGLWQPQALYMSLGQPGSSLMLLGMSHATGLPAASPSCLLGFATPQPICP